MQINALGAQRGTNNLYHSWAGLAATMNNHGVQQDSSACFTNSSGKGAIALPEGEELYYVRLICTTIILTPVGLQTSNNNTINNAWLLLSLPLLKIDYSGYALVVYFTTQPETHAYESNVTRGAIH